MATLIADQGVSWLCKCGERPLRHHEYCDRCGEARPAPPPEPESELSDVGRPDVAWSALEAEMQRADEPNAVDREQEWR